MASASRDPRASRQFPQDGYDEYGGSYDASYGPHRGDPYHDDRHHAQPAYGAGYPPRSDYDPQPGYGVQALPSGGYADSGGSVYGGGSAGSVYGGGSGGSVYGSGGSVYGGGSAGSADAGGKAVNGKAVNNRIGNRGANGKPPKRRSPAWAKALIAFGSVIMALAAAAMIIVPTFVQQVAKSIKTENLLGDEASGASIDGSINMLLVGLDTRPNNSIGTRSDSIIIAHIPKNHQGVYLISIPRDTDAQIPAFPLTHAGPANLKINAAFQRGSMNGGGESGGFQLLAKTITANYGIKFQAGVIVNFAGFTDIVKKLGGVDMYVDELTTSIHHGYINGDRNQHAKPFNINPNTGVPRCPGNYTFDSAPLKCALPGVTPVQYKKGFQHLSAYDALDFVRCRDGLPYTDYDRQRHQQQFIKALLKEAYQKGMSDPTKLSGFLKSISKAFIFSAGSSSMEDWIFTLKAISPNSVVTIKTNDGKYVHYTGPAPDSRQALNADSMKLLQAVKDDQVDSFVAAHPDWVANS